MHTNQLPNNQSKPLVSQTEPSKHSFSTPDSKLKMINEKIKRKLSNIYDRAVFRFIIWASGFFFKSLCKGKVTGQQNIENNLDKGFILAPNHVSYLDWLVLWSFFKSQYQVELTFLAKEKLFRHPVWGSIMRRAKCIMVSNDGKRIISEDGHKRLQKAKYIGIFPEGERSRSGELLPAKPGIIKFSQHFNKPIIPTGLIGFYEAWPPEQRLPTPTNCAVNFGCEMQATKTLTKEQMHDELESLMCKIDKLSSTPYEHIAYLEEEVTHAF